MARTKPAEPQIVMPSLDGKVFDPDSGSWRAITPDEQWTPVDLDQTLSSAAEPEVESSSEAPPITPRCDEIGKRHQYRDRKTKEDYDYCLKCGAAKPEPGQSQRTRSAVVPRASGKQAQTLDIAMTTLWFGGGALVRNMAPPVDHTPDADNTTGDALRAVGRMMQLESSIAGPKLHKLLKLTPIYPYLSIASGQLSWATDLGMILLPPLVAGLAAARPDLARQFKPALVAVLTPVLAEIAKSTAQQAALLETIQSYDSEVVDAANAIIDDLIGAEPESEPVN